MRVFGRRWRPTRGGGSKEAWTAIARNMEDHWSLVLGFDSNSDSSISATVYFFYFFFFVGCGFCDQRRAQMLVTSLGGIASFSVGLGVKNSCRAWGYIQIVGAGLGLFKISWGKNLKGTVIFGWLALLMILLSSGCLRLCCMDRNLALIPKLT